MKVVELFEDNTENIVELIKTNCSTMFNFYKKYPKCLFYRGVSNTDAYIIKNIPKNRIPRNTTYDVTDIADDYFRNAGFHTNRSNCIFMSANYSMAGSYGNGYPYIVFPYDPFNFLWSPIIEDFTNDFYEERYNNDTFLEITKYRENDDLYKAWKSKNEIMVSASKWIGIKFTHYNELKEFF